MKSVICEKRDIKFIKELILQINLIKYLKIQRIKNLD